MAQIVSDPSYSINLNNNVVDGQSMAGGYNAWQLLPYGPRVAPVTKENGPYTVADSDKLVMYKANNNMDIYLPTAGSDFNRNEKITIQGPNQQAGGRSTIIMRGMESGTIISWVYSATNQ